MAYVLIITHTVSSTSTVQRCGRWKNTASTVTLTVAQIKSRWRNSSLLMWLPSTVTSCHWGMGKVNPKKETANLFQVWTGWGEGVCRQDFREERSITRCHEDWFWSRKTISEYSSTSCGRLAGSGHTLPGEPWSDHIWWCRNSIQTGNTEKSRYLLHCRNGKGTVEFYKK